MTDSNTWSNSHLCSLITAKFSKKKVEFVINYTIFSSLSGRYEIPADGRFYASLYQLISPTSLSTLDNFGSKIICCFIKTGD